MNTKKPITIARTMNIRALTARVTLPTPFEKLKEGMLSQFREMPFTKEYPATFATAEVWLSVWVDRIAKEVAEHSKIKRMKEVPPERKIGGMTVTTPDSQAPGWNAARSESIRKLKEWGVPGV